MAALGSLALLAVVGVRSLGLEFLPHLEEGNLWIRATLPPSISLEEATPYVNRMRQIIKRFPEVVTVISQLGRPDDGTDTTGFFNAEFNVPLKPFDTWPKGVDKEKLTQQVNDALAAEFPGVDFNFSQYIEDNVEEAASGVKGENSVKLYGNDLEAIQKTAYKIKQVMKTVPGITDLSVFDSLGQPTVNIDIDRERAARYGLAPGDINSTIQAAIGGQAAGNVYEYGSDRNFPIVVRLAPQYRQSLDAIRHITIGAPNPSGSGVVPIPLTDVAKVSLVSGPSFIYRENQERYIPIKFSVRGRDLGGAVLEAQRKVAEQVPMPAGSRLEWVGEFGDLQDALERLEVVVPLSIALILLLLFVNFSSLVDTLLAASVMPMALIGGIFALWITGTPFSVSAAIGFVGLFGISVMEGIIILSYFNTLDRCRRGALRSGHSRLSDPVAPGDDDLHRRLRRSVAGRRVDRHRLAGAEAAGAGDRRRHPAGAGADPDRDAGADRHVLAPEGAGWSASTTAFACGIAMRIVRRAARLLARCRNGRTDGLCRRSGFRATRVRRTSPVTRRSRWPSKPPRRM